MSSTKDGGRRSGNCVGRDRLSSALLVDERHLDRDEARKIWKAPALTAGSSRCVRREGRPPSLPHEAVERPANT